MKQILIVEDDSFLNKMLAYNLTADGYEVTSALNARTATDILNAHEFDLVLLDVNLPDGNGYDLCRLIKPEQPDTIVIFLTANDQESDQIRGYEVGAVDYITKPFNILEVKARIKAIMWRTSKLKQTTASPMLIKGNMRIDCESRRVFIGDREINLTAKEFDVLELLATNPNKVYSRENLLNLVWGYDYPGDARTVDVHIRRLREKIEFNPSEPKYVHTKWGVGYYFQG